MNVPFSQKVIVPHSRTSYWICLILALSGLAFLFFLGFPFGNHNESYAWVVLLDKISFFEALTTRLGPVQSLRPFGTATAWLTYKVSDGIQLQQLVNWIFASLAFIKLYSCSGNKPFFSITLFLASVGFFSGYIYLYHLHGVFYGPLQLYIAYLTCAASKPSVVSIKRLAVLFLITIAAAFYHTFALLVFAAYLCGVMLQVPKDKRKRELPLLFLFVFLAISLMLAILSMHGNSPKNDLVKGILASFTTTELNLPLHVLAAAFSLFTVYSTILPRRQKHLYAFVTAAFALLLIFFHIPVLLLWILVCIIKSIYTKNWSLGAIIFSTAIFPVATHTGTPTYIVFVIMVCVYVMAQGSRLIQSLPGLLIKLIPAFIVLLLFILIALKLGVKLPVIANGLTPVLAEKEKTRQLEDILAWKIKEPNHANQALRFFEESEKPVASKNAIKRKSRPPTQQIYLDRYTGAATNKLMDTLAHPPLLILFGGTKLTGRHLLLQVHGPWNGDAYVYE